MTIFKSALGVLAGAIAVFIGTANVAHAEPYLAEIRTFAQHECPAGWLPTDGRLLQVAHYPALESVLEDRFGATSRRDFALPKLPVPESTHDKLETQCIAANGVYPTGNNTYLSEHYIGEIRLFATEHCPAGWLKTSGGLYPANHYVALYAVLHRRYGGGDGRTFRVPDNPRIFAAGHHELNECIAAVGIWPYWD